MGNLQFFFLLEGIGGRITRLCLKCWSSILFHHVIAVVHTEYGVRSRGFDIEFDLSIAVTVQPPISFLGNAAARADMADERE